MALDLAGFRHGNSIDKLDVLGTQALGYADGIKVLCDGIERGRNIAGLYLARRAFPFVTIIWGAKYLPPMQQSQL